MSEFTLAPLGELAMFINGDRGTNYPSQSDFADEGIPFINAGHLIDGEVAFAKMNYITEERFQKLGSGKTKANDLLYCLRGSLGKTAIVRHNGNAAIASSLVIIRPFEECFVEYLYRYLVSPFGDAEIRRYDTGSAQPNLSATSVKKYQIPLPPLAEQKRIAGILDVADALRARRRESLALLDTLLQSTFLNMFGDPVTNPMDWEIRALDDLAYNEDGKRIPVKKTDRGKMAGDFPYYGASGIIDFVDDYLFDGERLLIGEDGANLVARSTPIAFIAKGQYWVNNHAHVLAFNGSAELVFLEAFINAIDLKPYLSGTAQPKLNQKSLNRIPIPTVPLDLQSQYAAIVESVEQQKANQHAHLDELDTLFASLQSRAFRGDL